MHRKQTAAWIAATAMTLAFSTAAFAAAAGDVNGDGTFSADDLSAFAQYLTGQGDITDGTAADLSGDGTLNAVDYTLMKQDYIAAQSAEPEPEPQPSETDDTYVTQITFAADSVTLKNAADEVISADKASNVTVENGTFVTITKPTENGTEKTGDINIDGECANGQIKVDVDETTYAEGQVTVNLRGLTLSNENDSPIYVAQIADEFVITVKKDTVNTISDGKEYTNADQSAGAIYSLDDMKIKGKGTLIVNGNCGDGIVSKDDIKLWNGDIQVTAVDDGIRGKDSIRMGDPDATDGYESLKVTVTSKNGDGLKSTNDTADSGKGYICINGGTLKITAENGDGIQAEQAVEVNGGDINIYTYQGSGFTGTATGGGGGWGGSGGGMGMDGNASKTDISAKGIKAVGLYDESGSTWQSVGDITINGGTITVDSSDDSLHCGGSMTLKGGVFYIQTADDAFHSDHDLTVGTENAGTYDDVQICITKAYEGIEGVNIYQNSGLVYIVSTDDGYNAAGGADGSGQQGGWGFGPGGMSSSYGELHLRGGIVVVNSANGDHDGLDSNGPINITGGYYCCNGQEPLDCGDGYSTSQTGGTYITMTAGNTNLKTLYTFTDSTGKAIVSFYSASGNAGISTKDNSKCYSGGQVSGGTELASGNVIIGGTLSGGTEITGSASGGGGFGPGWPF